MIDSRYSIFSISKVIYLIGRFVLVCHSLFVCCSCEVDEDEGLDYYVEDVFESQGRYPGLSWQNTPDKIKWVTMVSCAEGIENFHFCGEA